MELRQLSAIVGIADHGSFSAAADALQTVQSNISAHVKKLERELGCELVDRSTGQVTEAGALVVARSRRVQVELDAMLSDVLALTRDVAGTVRIGIIGTTARWLVPQLLRTVPQRYPHLHLVFVELTSTRLDVQLATGEVDLAVLNLPATGSDLALDAPFRGGSRPGRARRAPARSFAIGQSPRSEGDAPIASRRRDGVSSRP